MQIFWKTAKLPTLCLIKLFEYIIMSSCSVVWFLRVCCCLRRFGWWEHLMRGVWQRGGTRSLRFLPAQTIPGFYNSMNLGCGDLFTFLKYTIPKLYFIAFWPFCTSVFNLSSICKASSGPLQPQSVQSKHSAHSPSCQENTRLGISSWEW